MVKQVSSEEKEDPNAAGQFGTGFMTTHKFSRKVIIRGSYEVDNGEYVELKDDHEFVLDRTENDLPKFIDLMGNQLKQVDELLQMPTFLSSAGHPSSCIPRRDLSTTIAEINSCS